MDDRRAPYADDGQFLVAVLGDYLPLKDIEGVPSSGCPFHGPEHLLDGGGRPDDLEVLVARAWWRCKVCGANGDVVDFVRAYERISAEAARAMLDERFATYGRPGRGA